MDVVVLRPLCERLRDYRPGDRLPVSPERAARLEELGFVSVQRAERPTQATAPGEKEYAEGWRKLRALIGAKRTPFPTCADGWRAFRERIHAKCPRIQRFPTHRSSLSSLRPGEKLLILLRYSGIGDYIVTSMMFPALREQYPGIHVSYAIPTGFHPLFEGTGVCLVPYDGDFQPVWLREYDLIEDINTAPHIWEHFCVEYGGTSGDWHGIRRMHRLDVMSRWFGLKVRNPHSEITIREEEKQQARRLLSRGSEGKPVCLLAPISFQQSRSYPWFVELSQRLQSDGWIVRLLHHTAIPGPVPTITGLSIRMMGAVISVADLLVSVDTAAFHWAGICGRPAVAIFNSQLGVVHCRDYPTVHPVQTCATPCIHNVRWGGDNESCSRLTRDTLPRFPAFSGRLSRCFGRKTVEQIMETVRSVTGRP